METILARLKQGEKAIIKNFSIDAVPLKLIEMGCLSGNMVKMIHIAPLGDPIYININDTHVAIRMEIAKEINVEIITD